MGLGKLTLYCDQGATFRTEVRVRAPLIDLASGDPILAADGQVLAGPPISLTGYTGRMHVRKTLAATEFDLELTTGNGGVLIPQPFAFLIGWCRLATDADHPVTGLDPIDGVTPITGDRILVKAQTAAQDNGVYVAAITDWARPPDADEASNLSQGASVWVREGRHHDDTTWRQTESVTDITTSPQVWVRDDTIGVFQLKATAEATQALTASGVYDLEMVAQNGDVTRVLEGKFRLSKEVTRT